MKDATRRASSIFVIGLAVLETVGLVASVIFGDSVELYGVGAAWPFSWVGFLIVGAYLVARVPENRIAWSMFGIGALVTLGTGVGENVFGMAPSLDRLLAWMGSWLLIPALTLLVLFLLWYPTGHVLAPRWRIVERGTIWVGALLTVYYAVRPGPVSDFDIENPLGIEALSGLRDGPFESVMGMVLGAGAIAAMASLVIRWRRAEWHLRQQLKWVLAPALLLPVGTIVVGLAVPEGGFQDVLAVLVTLCSLIGIAVGVGIAITRHALYGIDVVINKTLVFGALATFITGIYVVVVVGLGGLVGGSSVWLSVGATAVAAIAFEPFRTRVQRWANRVVYGKRATPYEVLSDVNRRLAAAEAGEGLLDRMAGMLAAGTGAVRTGVWSRGDGEFTLVAADPPGSDLSVASEDALPGTVQLIRHDGEVVGALTVEMSRGEALSATERRLVADLAGSAALVLRKARLDSALAERAAELEVSRRRLVDAQDVERRRLERDLHDGAQQLVVALKVKLGLAELLARREGSEKTAGLIRQMADDTGLALEQIRSLAQGIYPPLLQADGLAAAIPALAALSPQVIEVDVALARRHPIEIEGAIYFCVSEALTNAAKHARGPVSIVVTERDGALAFSVSDSGPGFDPAAAGAGSGLRNIRDRVEALGGTVHIASTPGGVTVVAGSLPTP